MKLYKYQQTYIDALNKNCIMSADVGLGKTVMSLAHYKKYGANRPLLILAPASKVKTGDWQREIERYLGVDQPREWWVVSYDKFARNPRGYESLKDLCIIADECHFICDSQTKRGKAVRRIIATSSQFMGLSATPLPNGWRSMENYAIIFGLVKNKTQFIKQFTDYDRSRGYPVLMGYKQERVMEKFWAGVSRNLERDGVIDLKPATTIGENIKMPVPFRKQYADMKKYRIGPKGELLDNPSKLFSALRQTLTPLRRDALQSIIESTEEHIVVFYNFNNERDMILDVLKKLEKNSKRVVYEQSGHASNLPERGNWDTMPPSVTLAQYQSASTAIELSYASITIFLSPTYSYANFHQARGRTHRPGQTRRVLFYTLSVENSIDRDVWRALRKKRDFSETLWLAEHQKEVDM